MFGFWGPLPTPWAHEESQALGSLCSLSTAPRGSEMPPHGVFLGSHSQAQGCPASFSARRSSADPPPKGTLPLEEPRPRLAPGCAPGP